MNNRNLSDLIIVLNLKWTNRSAQSIKDKKGHEEEKGHWIFMMKETLSKTLYISYIEYYSVLWFTQ